VKAAAIRIGVKMSHAKTYALKDGVQVRREAFGLLFYDYRGPRLYFVPTRDLIEDEFFNGRCTVAELISHIGSRHGWPIQWIEDRIDQVLTMLEKKDLIYGQSVC
jgi:putative mycofactocin binding protein MftB